MGCGQSALPIRHPGARRNPWMRDGGRTGFAEHIVTMDPGVRRDDEDAFDLRPPRCDEPGHVSDPAPASLHTRRRTGAWVDAQSAGGARKTARRGSHFKPATRDADRQLALSQSARRRRGSRQGWGRGRRAVRDGLRRGRDGDADAAAAGGQPQAAAVSAGRGSRRHQPDGVQQWRPGSGPRQCARRQAARRAAGHQRRRQQGRDRSRRRLRHRRHGGGPPRRLCYDQHLVAQHAGPARPATWRGARRTARRLYRSAGRHAAVPEDRSRSRCGGDRRHRPCGDRTADRCDYHGQHHGIAPVAAQPAGRRDGRPVGRAPGRARPPAAGRCAVRQRRRHRADRGGGRRQRRGGLCAYPGRRIARAALFGTGLRRTRPRPAPPDRSRHLPRPRRLRLRDGCRRGGTACPNAARR